jgi:hypothetical protein
MHLDYYGDKFKWFVGVVRDKGTDKNRVRVRIFGIHRMDDTLDVSNGDLPEAVVLYPTTGGQTSGGNLSHGLTPGTWVMGFFADGDDCQQPVIVGVMNGGVNSSNNTDMPRTTTPGSPADGSASSTVSSSSLNVQGNTNAEKIYNMVYELIEKSGQSGGNIHAQVSGILGNILAESNANPNSGNPNDKGAAAYGLCQWRLDRLTALKRKYGNSPDLAQQVSHMWDEFMGSENHAFKRIMVAKNFTEATMAMCFFERPQCYKGSYIDTNDSTFKPRLSYAEKVYSSYKYTPRDTSRGR